MLCVVDRDALADRVEARIGSATFADHRHGDPLVDGLAPVGGTLEAGLDHAEHLAGDRHREHALGDLDGGFAGFARRAEDLLAVGLVGRWDDVAGRAEQQGEEGQRGERAHRLEVTGTALGIHLQDRAPFARCVLLGI